MLSSVHGYRTELYRAFWLDIANVRYAVVADKRSTRGRYTSAIPDYPTLVATVIQNIHPDDRR